MASKDEEELIEATAHFVRANEKILATVPQSHEPDLTMLPSELHRLFRFLERFAALPLPMDLMDVNVKLECSPFHISSWQELAGNPSLRSTEEENKAVKPDLINPYSTFATIPSLRLTAPHVDDGLSGTHDKYALRKAVPLYVFKNLMRLHIVNIDMGRIFGWHRIAQQLRVLTLNNTKIKTVDALGEIVLHDMQQEMRGPKGAVPDSGIDLINDINRAMSLTPLTYPVPEFKWRCLKSLTLRNNGLTDFPNVNHNENLRELGATLTSLDLSENIFTHIPDGLNSLGALKSLNLSNCKIKSLDSLQQNSLVSLESLDLESNLLKELEGIQHLTNLEILDIRFNKIGRSEETKRLTNIPHIREIYLEGNPFMGEVSNNASIRQERKIFDYFLLSGNFHQGFITIDGSTFTPSSILVDVINTGDHGVLQKVLEESFDLVTQCEYRWLHELVDIGYNYDDIAELLLEEAMDSPWIYFEKQERTIEKVDIDYHQPSCVHNGGLNASSRLQSGQTTESIPEGLPLLDNRGQDLNRVVEESCGLAGVAPISRDQSLWNGGVHFDAKELIASVTYASPNSSGNNHLSLLQRIHTALEGFHEAVAYVQGSGLCCNSYTVITKSRLSKNSGGTPFFVEMRRIDLGLFQELEDEVQFRLGLKRVKGLVRKGSCLSEVLWSHGLYEPPSKDTYEEYLHRLSLAVQVLCLGFLAYCRAHSGVLRPFFLDCPVQRVNLHGSNPIEGDSPTIIMQLGKLTCIGEMLQDEVLIFSRPKRMSLEKENSNTQYDLLASPENLMDTWGPGEFIRRSSEKPEEYQKAQKETGTFAQVSLTPSVAFTQQPSADVEERASTTSEQKGKRTLVDSSEDISHWRRNHRLEREL